MIVGCFGAPYGLRGWVRVTSFTHPASNIRQYRPWHTLFEREWNRCDVIGFHALSKGFAVELEGIADRTHAETLTGKNICVESCVLPAIEDDEIYWKDLVGLCAQSPDGADLGQVTALIPAGAHDVLVINTDDSKEPLLIPLHREYVPDIDVAHGRLVVDISLLEV